MGTDSAPQAPFSLDIDTEALRAAFAPSVHREVPAGDPEWESRERKLQLSVRWKAFAARWLPWLERRGQHATVKDNYEGAWQVQDNYQRLDVAIRKPQPIVWGDRRFYASQVGAKRVHLVYLAALIAKLRPARVLEVGSGLGQNAMLLAARFPDVEFTGLELTAQGLRVSAQTRAGAQLPDVLQRYAPFPLVDPQGHQRVRFMRGSADVLPFGPRSFDLVYTVQALEQMESIRPKALDEIARVSSGHVAMFEPFRDWNRTAMRRAKTGGWGFFSAAVADLPAHGLTPVFTTDDLPTKAYYGVGLVVARAS